MTRVSGLSLSLAVPEEAHSLSEVLEQLEHAGEDRERITVRDMLETLGERSFAPALLLAGLIAVSPLSGIPGMPTTVAIMVVLVAGQLALNRPCFWLPDWVLCRKVGRRRFCRALRLLRRPADFVDRHLLRRRLTFLTGRQSARLIGIACIAVALTMPPLEILPFAATTAGAAITAFALSLVARDGLMALVALGFVAGVVAVAVRAWA